MGFINKNKNINVKLELSLFVFHSNYDDNNKIKAKKN